MIERRKKGVEKMAIHIVQRGETLWNISQIYGAPVETIRAVNGLPTIDRLTPGLSLYIPDQHLPMRYYKIKASDTINKLAQRFNTSPFQIYDANPGLSPSQLTVGSVLVIPSPNKNVLKTLGFIVPNPGVSYTSTLEGIAGNLTYIAVAAYSFTEEGYVYIQADDDNILSASKQWNVTPLLMVRNYTDEDFNPELIGNVLKDPVFRRNFIDSLLHFIMEKGYGGVSIDFEFIPPLQRANFVVFLYELKQRLGSLLLHVNVHAKTEDIPSNPIIGAYDYEEIGNVADIVAVMTIDYGYPTGPPNPVSPIWWMEQVIKFATSLIDPNKLQVSFPLYGYDWKVPENTTSARSVLSAQNLAIQSGSIIQYDTNAASPFYQYWKVGENHIVWFEDIRSFQEKYKLLDIYDLLGTTYWQISLPFPQNWWFVSENLIISKE
jgi:spore germination protein